MGNIQVLNLRGNRIKNVEGIDHMYSLEKLDLGKNMISSLADVSGLANLPELMELELNGNPLENDGYKMSYRLKLLNLFKESRVDKSNKSLTYRELLGMLPCINGMLVTNEELLALRDLTFSQSVTIEKINSDDFCKESQRFGEKDPSIKLMEPFRDEYSGASVTNLQPQGHRRTIRKVQRKKVTIINSRSQRIRFKRVQKENVQNNLNLCPSLEKVITSMFEHNVHIKKVETPSGDKSVNSNIEDVDTQWWYDDLATASPNEFTGAGESVLDQIDAALADPIILYEKIEAPTEPNICDGKEDEVASLQSDTVNNDDDLSVKDANTVCEDSEVPTENKTQEKLKETFNFAIAERTSIYDGPDACADLSVKSYWKLYFECFVFPQESTQGSTILDDDFNLVQQKTLVPRIQLYQSDRDLMMWTRALKENKEKGLSPHHVEENLERLVAVTTENIIPCGIAAIGRIAPVESEVKNIRGGTLFEEGKKPLMMSECQNLLFCISSDAIYFIPSSSNSEGKKKDSGRHFPSPIPSETKFDEALWPHAFCRHPLKFLKSITFDGFGFQRLTLHFKLPSVRGEVYVQPESGGLLSAFDYTYVICTCNQKRTIELMRTLQNVTKEASPNGAGVSSLLKVENDDNAVQRAIGSALGPKTFNDDIIHYQILHQIMQPSDKLGPRRALIVTNERIILVHETYTGDVFGSAFVNDENVNHVESGNVVMRVVAGTDLDNLTDVSVLDEDSRKVSITLRTKTGLRRTSRWLLLCRNSENAEKTVNDVRRACAK